MSRYDEEYGTGWDTLDKDEATERAYAIGVAERLGEFNREELERIYREMDSAYNKSMVELAYEEGRQEAADIAALSDDGEAVWADLVRGEKTFVDPEDVPTGGRDGLPEVLDSSELLDRVDIDSTDAVDRPDFLER